MKTKISVLVLAALCSVSMSACNFGGSAVITEQAERIEQLESEAAELQAELDNERSRADELQKALDEAITAKPESLQEAPPKPEEKEKPASSSAVPEAISSAAPATPQMSSSAPPSQPESKPESVASSPPPPPASSSASSVPPVSQPQASSSSSGVTFSFGGSGGAVSSSSSASTAANTLSHAEILRIAEECADKYGLQWNSIAKEGGFDPGVSIDNVSKEEWQEFFDTMYGMYSKQDRTYIYGEVTVSRHGYHVFVLYR